MGRYMIELPQEPGSCHAMYIDVCSRFGAHSRLTNPVYRNRFRICDWRHSQIKSNLLLAFQMTVS